MLLQLVPVLSLLLSSLHIVYVSFIIIIIIIIIIIMATEYS